MFRIAPSWLRSRWTALIPFALLACSTSPLDATVVNGWTSSYTPVLPFQGFVPPHMAGTPIQMFLLDPNTKQLKTNLATSFANPAQTYSWFGEPSIPFDGAINVDWSQGTPGANGRYAFLRSPGLFHYRGDMQNCSGFVKTVDQFIRQCSTPDVLICSSGFRKPSSASPSRRFGCPTTRGIKVNNVELRGRRDDTTTFSIKQSPMSAANATVDFAWRGDDYSFVDIFDSDLASTSLVAREGTHGSFGSAFMRLPVYVHEPEDTTWDSGWKINGGIVRSGYSWRGTQSIKLYDRGACSVTVPWRSLLNEFVILLDRELMDGSDKLMTLELGSRASLTPILRTSMVGEPQGAFSFVQVVVAEGSKFGISGQIRARLRLVVGVQATANGVESSIFKFQLEKLNSNFVINFLDNWGIINTDQILADARTKIEARLKTQVDAQLRALGMGTRRINFRPEGIEFVQAESAADANYALARAFGMCRRAERNSVVSFFGGVFDPPFDSDPEVYRDTKDHTQRIMIGAAGLRGVLLD